MKLIARLVILPVIIYSCNYTPTTIHDKIKDSTIIEEVQLEEIKYDSSAHENIDLIDVLGEYKRSYDNPVEKKGVFAIGNDTLSVSLKHICLMDSAVVIPSKYVKWYKLDSFVTHNFETQLTIKRNGVLVKEEKVTKERFNEFLDESLKKYAVLLGPPYIRSSNDSVFVHYSISIPLTDVGIGAAAVVLPDGSVIYTGDR